MERLVECVPNFSEGRNRDVLRAIESAIQAVNGVRLLHVDPGAATNRTVFTFVGEPDAVAEAAFQAAKAGCALIDMHHHKGEHPRFGAMDVCPFVPIRGVTIDDCVAIAKAVGKRLGDELGISVYLYESAASAPERSNLADVRAGEYEGLEVKLRDPAWKPDFGPTVLNGKSGACAVGARDFLIAYNVNLNTTSVRRANAVAFDIREKGRVLREGGTLSGEIVRDADGNTQYAPGALKNVKAIGWYIEEYGIAQVSINLTNMRETPLHEVFETCVEKAATRGIRVTGSELVGLVPLQALLDAGRHFLHKQQRSTGVSNAELIKIAVRSMGLDELSPFDVSTRVIEYAVESGDPQQLVDMTLQRFVEETASESPAPGGGSISATMGAMGVALGTMVANLSSHKRGWDERWQQFSDWADQGKALQERLLSLIDQDTNAFDDLMAAFGLPKGTDEEKAERKRLIQAATQRATEVPLEVMRVACQGFAVVKAMVEIGNPNSISDAGVGALALRSAVMGAYLNVRINVGGLADKELVEKLVAEATTLRESAMKQEALILELIEKTFD